MLFTRNKDVNANEAQTAAESFPPGEFIPYYCHIDPHTLLTKNGEPMQILRITHNRQGLNYESGGTEAVRDTIRSAILTSIPNEKFSLWIHTLRRRHPIRFAAQFKEPFAAYAHKEWRKQTRWRHQYYNEIYISILHEGEPAALFDKAAIRHHSLSHRNRRERNAYLDRACEELTRISNALMEDIGEHYQIERLGIEERRIEGMPGVFYSQPMEFLGLMVNLNAQEFPLGPNNISSALPVSELTFGFNAVEAHDAQGHRRFGAVLTLKQYREIPLETADRILQAPMEFIVSQAFRFIPAKRALKPFKEQRELFSISGDGECIEATGIDDMIKCDQRQPIDFAEQQTNIMVFADDYKQLDRDITRVQSEFGELGLITIREDVRMEECFWAQLPGNFEFLHRRESINTLRIGGFCRLNRYPGGNAAGNRWGNAITLIPTSVNSPYFFNFHDKDSGHTVLFDFNSFGDSAATVLLNFLLTETRQYDGRLFVFDRQQSTRLLFDRLAGQYHRFSTAPQAGTLMLNPFALEDSPRNRSFLLAWAGALLGTQPSDAQKEIIRAAIDYLYTQPDGARTLSALVAQVATQDPSLAGGFAPWLPGGALGGLANGKEQLDLAQPLHGFDMTPIVQRPEAIIPIFSYVLHRIISSLDGRPTIIVLHEAWDLLENAFFAPRLESLLDMLTQSNAIMILATRHPAQATSTHTLATALQKCATRLYIPDDVVSDYDEAGLSDDDAQALGRMERQNGDFLLKQGGESIGLKVDLRYLSDIHAIFAGDVKNLLSASSPFSYLPKYSE